VPALSITEGFNDDDLRPGSSSPLETTANGPIVQAALDIAARVEVEKHDYDAPGHFLVELVENAGTAANGPDYGAGRVEYDVASALIIYEEYHPFGTSAYRAVDSTIQVSAKRYRYAAAERD
jgi:hypothetical protein